MYELVICESPGSKPPPEAIKERDCSFWFMMVLLLNNCLLLRFFYQILFTCNIVILSSKSLIRDSTITWFLLTLQTIS